MSDHFLPYSHRGLNRAGNLRTDPQWVQALLASPQARLLPFWRDKCLVEGAAASPRPVSVPAAAISTVLASASECVFLGLDGAAGVFAADLSELEQSQAVELVTASAAQDVRRLVATILPAEAAALAYARGLLHWNRNQKFCGACGGNTQGRNGGHLRVCMRSSCGKLLFPRIEPAVIVLVEAPSLPARCLLGRHRGAPQDSYSTLAGFVELGESLEDAVRREVAEEAGVQVDTVTYQASQAWPFPAGLMVGFRARAIADKIAVDEDELIEARWFTRAELHAQAATEQGARSLFNADSIEKFLIEAWMHENQ